MFLKERFYCTQMAKNWHSIYLEIYWPRGRGHLCEWHWTQSMYSSARICQKSLNESDIYSSLYPRYYPMFPWKDKNDFFVRKKRKTLLFQKSKKEWKRKLSILHSRHFARLDFMSSPRNLYCSVSQYSAIDVSLSYASKSVVRQTGSSGQCIRGCQMCSGDCFPVTCSGNSEGFTLMKIQTAFSLNSFSICHQHRPKSSPLLQRFTGPTTKDTPAKSSRRCASR